MILVEKIKLDSIYKKYPGQDNYVIQDLNLSIDECEFVVLVGPSGSGKSTVLRMIAGLEDISDGQLYIDGIINNQIPSSQRNIAMVFQNYALFPHMTVFQNIEYGLKVRGMNKVERTDKVTQAAKILGLTPYLHRKPKELSGGQMQRVAVGRAIVRDTNIFLFDEPLSNLDAKLRTQMREEIVHLQHRLQATFIYVTHDQAEAMTMADRIVVMENGNIMQVGTPEEIYNHPKNLFVASFMGTPEMNILDGQLDEGVLQINPSLSFGYTSPKNQEVAIGIRPENIVLSSQDDSDGNGIVSFVEVTGADSFVHIEVENDTLVMRTDPSQNIKRQDKVYFKLKKDTIHLFDKVTGEKININD